MRTEESDLDPQTAYAECKLLVERDVAALAAPGFAPVFLRNATAFGPSPRMRFDLVVNTLTVRAVVDGRIAIFGGDQWRPNVHCRDAARAFLMALEADGRGPLRLAEDE